MKIILDKDYDSKVIFNEFDLKTVILPKWNSSSQKM